MPERAGQPVRVAAARGADLGQGAHRVGQRVGDQHRRDAEHQRPAQRLQRAHAVAGHDLVGHREPGRLGAAAVVAAHRLDVHRAPGVGDELCRGGGQLAQLGPDRLDEHADRLGRDLPTGPAHLRRARSRPARPGGASSQRATWAPALRSASASALFRALPACWTTSVMPSPGAMAWSSTAAEASLPASCAPSQHDDARLGEQGRAQALGQVAQGWRRGRACRRSSTSGSVDARGVRHDASHGPLDQQLLLAEHEVQRRRGGLGGHRFPSSRTPTGGT